MSGRRHDLLTLDPAWASPDPIVAAWLARGLPVMRRRAAPGDAPGRIPVCIARPRHMPPSRIAFTVPPDAVIAVRRPPGLRETEAEAPPGWGPTIAAVLAIAARRGIEPAVFGSFLWQSLSGEIYLGPHSDLDLLWDVASDLKQLDGLLGDLASLDGLPRLDGEILFADDVAANWRECARGGEVLAKTIDGIALVAFSTLRGRAS